MSDEDELQSVLERVSQREGIAQRRAIFYTIIPILVGALLIWITWQQVDEAGAQLRQTQARLVESQQELGQAQQQTTALTDQLESSTADLTVLQSQVEELKNTTETLQKEAEKYQQEIAELQAERDSLQTAIDELGDQIEQSQGLRRYIYKGNMTLTLKELGDPVAFGLLFDILGYEGSPKRWHPGGIGPDQFDSPGFAAYILKGQGLVEGDLEKIHYSLINILPPASAPSNGDVIFYESGYTMFYFVDSTNHAFVVGMTPLGVIALEYDFAKRLGIGAVH